MPDSLERLDLLLIHEVRIRRVRPDGIHFHNFRYLSLTLAAYVGEDVTIRFALAGQTVPLRKIVNARKRRREQLRTIVKDRLKTVDTLLEFRRGMQREDLHASTAVPVPPKPSKLKRYFNE